MTDFCILSFCIPCYFQISSRENNIIARRSLPLIRPGVVSADNNFVRRLWWRLDDVRWWSTSLRQRTAAAAAPSPLRNCRAGARLNEKKRFNSINQIASTFEAVWQCSIFRKIYRFWVSTRRNLVQAGCCLYSSPETGLNAVLGMPVLKLQLRVKEGGDVFKCSKN